MADKLKQTIAVAPVFVAGESPTASKLSSITAQMRAANRRLEKAIGDIHDQSFPYSADAQNTRLSSVAGQRLVETDVGTSPKTRPLDIINLARLIGPASNLNPHELATNTITDVIPAGVHEFATRYPMDLAGVAPYGLTITDASLTNEVTAPDLVAAAGDYYIDPIASRVYSFTATAGGTIEYDIDPTKWGGGTAPQKARFNVIPDPAQLEAGGSGCTTTTVKDAEGRYTFITPTVSHQQWNNDQDSTVLDSSDPNLGIQLKLPSVLDKLAADAAAAGAAPPYQIPEGFCVLKNYTTGAVYTEATYWWVSDTQFLVGGIDIDAEITDGDLFCLVTVGTNITESIDDLRRKSRVAGSRSWGQELVDARHLTGWLAAAGASGAFGPSENDSNIAPQYLHRDGWRAGVDGGINDGNAMRGHLLLGKTGVAAGGHVATGGTTYKVAFGTDTQAWINWAASNLHFETTGGFNFVGGDAAFDSKVTVHRLRLAEPNTFETLKSEGTTKDPDGNAWLGNIAETGGSGVAGLRYPHFQDANTGFLSGHGLVKRWGWACGTPTYDNVYESFINAPRVVGCFYSGKQTTAGQAGHFLYLHSPTGVRVVGYYTIDMAQLIAGLGVLTSADCAFLETLWVKFVSHGDASNTSISATLYKNGASVGTVTVTGNAPGHAKLGAFAGTKVTEDDQLVLELTFDTDPGGLGGVTNKTMGFHSILAVIRNKYLFGP